MRALWLILLIGLASACPCHAAAVPVELVETLCDPASSAYAASIGVDSVQVCYTGVAVEDEEKTEPNRVEVIAIDEGLTVPSKGMEILNDPDDETWRRRIGVDYQTIEGGELTGATWNIEDSLVNSEAAVGCSEWPTGCNGVSWTECGVPPGTSVFQESNYVQYKRMLIGAERVTCQIRCVGAPNPVYRSCKIEPDNEPPWLNFPTPTNPQPPTGTCPCAGQPNCYCYPS